MLEATATECALREVVYRSYPSERTVTVRCTVRPAEGSARADGYGTAATKAVARLKALSEAVERLVACTPFASVVRPPTTSRGSGAVPPFPASGVRTVPDGCASRVYRPLTGGGPRRVPLYWSSPWTAGEELRAAVLTAPEARLSSTVGWAVAPTPEAALHGALLELTELLNHGVFLHRSLAGPRRPAAGDETLVLPLGGPVRTPTVLAVAYGRGRRMPATGLGCGATRAEATDRALLELAQAETMWRSNPTAVPAERFFLRRFERWPLLGRCATLDFDLSGHGTPYDDERSVASPLEELEAGGISVWADSGAVDISGPDTPRTRLCFAHVVSDPQPLLGLVRAGIPVFDTGEVRRTLDPPRRDRPAHHARSADHRAAGRGRQGRRTA
ncbi:hypothetical protein Sipo8835_41775 [Streptomyces ipomoeae]|nr:YcaO-like family protein [Streptomyces ipomoeae]MDX2698617.1 YcaO-like family protein [Streptomyces ipomoeae]MDX2825930.1 YcaO-like family protein [Streptomyces ipomoeae]MDX2844260.1 YcaO-like family protein [Streptomyces ipomoeae]MDX2878493.1 YcaO-like family protein [Streptomyces ipomoeae]TQE17575.1 hypothetical protein Sipo8835_41775 [Streptomyces ipomoeae]